MTTLTIPPEKEGQRIDVAISELLDTYSRTMVQRWIRKNLVKINGEIAKKGNRVVAGDVIDIKPEVLQESRFDATEIPLEIIYEDDNLLVVNKPPGLLTHPSAHEKQYTLVNALLHHCGERLSGIAGERRPGIVHRLDKDTSGLLMVAKHDEAHRDLARQIEHRLIEKHYLTLVQGVMESASGTIEAPLMKTREEKKHKVRVSPHRDAKDALTHFWVKETFQDQYSLLDVQIITGRMHQIRVHLSAIQHPVIGDEMYGNKKLNGVFKQMGLTRQFLHAFRLKFKHPRTEKWMEFEAPLPHDLQAVLDQLN